MRTRQPDNSAIPDICYLIFGKSCDNVFSNIFSLQFGLTLSAFGMAYFGLIGFLFSFNKPLIDKIVLIITGLGVGVSLLLSWILFRSKLFCPLCFGIHIINLSILIALFRNIIQIHLKNPTLYFKIRNIKIRWVFLLFISILFGGLSDYGILWLSFGQVNKVNLNEVQIAFQKEKVYTIPLNTTSAFLGSPDAPVQLVVFSSFECPACKAFAPALESLHKKFGEKIGISFKNFPLSNTCNPRLEGNMQPHSCDAALAALAAQNQNRFWEYHNQLFNSNLEEGNQILFSIAEKIGLDKEKWEKDRHSEAVTEKLSNDILLAYQLGINATPTIFINGKKVSSFQESALNFLIENELKNHSN